MKVDGQKMARHARCFVMTDIGVDLKGAWPSIAQVIQRGREPAGHDAEHGNQGEGGQHPYAEEEQGMKAKTSPRRLLWPWRVREGGRHSGGTAHPGCRGAPTARLSNIERVLLHSVINGLRLAHPRGPLHREHRYIGSGSILVHGDRVGSR